MSSVSFSIFTSSSEPPIYIPAGAYPSPYMYPSPHMFPFPSPMPGWNASPDASFFSMTLTQPMIYRPSL
ncbi:hypothetical protein Gotur_022092 [Gossypium turneri]